MNLGVRPFQFQLHAFLFVHYDSLPLKVGATPWTVAMVSAESLEWGSFLNLCIIFGASGVSDHCGNKDRADENSPHQIGSVVSPLRLPAEFCKDIGDVTSPEITYDPFHDIDSIRQHQGQPMPIAGFAISEGETAEHTT